MGDLSDLPPAASACHPLHRHRHERGGAYHAATLHLAHPNVWYTAEGGIQALSEMLSDLENALL